MIVRAGTAQDAAACAEIYAPHVVEGHASFEEVAPDAGEMARRIAAAHAWLVADDGGDVAGFAYGTPHMERAGYRWTVNTSIYVGGRHQGRGVGRSLYADLFELLEGMGFHMACAGVTLPNPASVAIHEAFGFVPVGVYRRIGFKFGQWHDVGWWQRPIGPERDPVSP